MLAPSPEIVHLLAQFASLFTRPTFDHALALVYGTILACGRGDDEATILADTGVRLAPIRKAHMRPNLWADKLALRA